MDHRVRRLHGGADDCQPGAVVHQLRCAQPAALHRAGQLSAADGRSPDHAQPQKLVLLHGATRPAGDDGRAGAGADPEPAGGRFFRTAFYLPSITPSVAAGTLFLWLLNPRVGLINQGLALLGIDGPGWTTDPNWIKPGIIVMSLWSLGSTVIILLAALRNVPNELYEAANIDGASGWRQFINITVPLISGSLFFVLIVNTISSLQIFTEVYT
ncbi:MAG: sugar ABC transporter permease, partial [Anaerolineae bacterium]|nr:sugar ABC transporter permease [Anaerolineae bacterium]